jgi:hypothetical protein
VNPDFTVTVCSSGQHKTLVAELYFRRAFVGLITQERGFDALEIELRPPKDGGPWRFALADFQEVIGTARQRLRALRKTS